MQRIGVYRGCICNASVFYTLPSTPQWMVESAIVLLSSNTMPRHLACGIRLGIASGVWVGLICLVAGSYRIGIGQSCNAVLEPTDEPGVELSQLNGRCR